MADAKALIYQCTVCIQTIMTKPHKKRVMRLLMKFVLTGADNILEQ